MFLCARPEREVVTEMPVVLVSRLPGSPGENVARLAAEQLGFEHLGPEVVQAAAAQAGVPEEKMHRALSDGRPLLGKSSAERRRLIAWYQAALCARLLRDDVVSESPFAHLFVSGVPHVLKVRIKAPFEVRTALRAAREGCDKRKAEREIAAEDKRRLYVAEAFFGADDDDEKMFNLVLDTSRLDEGAAADNVAENARLERYRSSTYSQELMSDIELSFRVRVSLLDFSPDVDVRVRKGIVKVRARVEGRGKEKRLEDMRRAAERVEGVKEVGVEAVTDATDFGGWLR